MMVSFFSSHAHLWGVGGLSHAVDSLLHAEGNCVCLEKKPETLLEAVVLNSSSVAVISRTAQRERPPPPKKQNRQRQFTICSFPTERLPKNWIYTARKTKDYLVVWQATTL